MLDKEFHSKPEVKRRRKHKQDAIEKKLLYEKRTQEYASGIGLDIGFSIPDPTSCGQTKRDDRSHGCKYCGLLTHKTNRSKKCPYYQAKQN